MYKPFFEKIKINFSSRRMENLKGFRWKAKKFREKQCLFWIATDWNDGYRMNRKYKGQNEAISVGPLQYRFWDFPRKKSKRKCCIYIHKT